MSKKRYPSILGVISALVLVAGLLLSGFPAGAKSVAAGDQDWTINVEVKRAGLGNILAVAAGDDSNIFAVVGGKVTSWLYYSTNGGTSWSAGGSGLPSLDLNADGIVNAGEGLVTVEIVPSPLFATDSTVFVMATWWNVNATNYNSKVFRSKDKGLTFSSGDTINSVFIKSADANVIATGMSVCPKYKEGEDDQIAVATIDKRDANNGAAYTWDDDTWSTCNLALDCYDIAFLPNAEKKVIAIGGNDTNAAPNDMVEQYCADITASTPSWAPTATTEAFSQTVANQADFSAKLVFGSDYDAVGKVYLVGVSNKNTADQAILAYSSNDLVSLSTLGMRNITGDVTGLVVSGPADGGDFIVGFTDGTVQRYDGSRWRIVEGASAPGYLSACDYGDVAKNCMTNAVLGASEGFKKETSQVAFCGLSGGLDNGSVATAGYAGVFKTADIGATWTTCAMYAVDINDYFYDLAIKDKSTIFVVAGAGETANILDKDGNVNPVEFSYILKSTDGGAAWTVASRMESIRKIAIAPDDANVLYALDNRAGTFKDKPPKSVKKSTDGGVTWAPTVGNPWDNDRREAMKTLLVIDKNTVIVNGASQMWVTKDGGATWVESTTTKGGTARNIEAMAFMKVGDVYHVLMVKNSNGMVYLSKNCGETSSQLGKEINLAGNAVAFDPDYATNGLVYEAASGGGAGGYGVWRIDSRTATTADDWKAITAGTTTTATTAADGVREAYALAFDANKTLWVAGNDGGTVTAIADRLLSTYKATADPSLVDWRVSPTLTNANFTRIGSLRFVGDKAPTITLVTINEQATTTDDKVVVITDTSTAPVLVMPANGATGAAKVLGMDWDAVANATSYDVRYSVVPDPPSSSDKNTTSSAIATSDWTNEMIDGSTYYWKVREGTPFEGPWSAIWSFTVGAAPSVTPTVTSGLSSIEGKYATVWAFIAATQTWVKFDPTAPAYANTLGTLEKGKGYWLEAKEGSTLVFGTNSYSLSKGWNLLGWLG